MKTILFQGDSITDTYRHREEDWYRGHGYATMVAASLGFDRPGEFRFINRGVSGNRSVDLLARIHTDIINLKPDYMSILIGVNDVWHGMDASWYNGVDAEHYEIYYDLLIEQVKKALPNIKIMILEPFLLKGFGTVKEDDPEYWNTFRSEVEKRAAIAKRLAEKHGLVFVPLMKAFDEAAERISPELWLLDGVHPTAEGYELIKREWLKGFEKMECDSE